MKTIEQLTAIQIEGNYNSDQELWSELEDFILVESHPMSERITALEMVDKLLGEPVPVTEKDVVEYVAMMKSERGLN